ncbi:2-amino-4-hydroxy-6-hydroxymethyldihydropteridine diphosphokinase [Aliiroseovarius sp. YM-037]|uniref:2-amino-4-hydroxy-6- hydroxymethyldihydropteridine diphosphokinase n=1 Tax=Aliiroseovarius sp. YM-037 TaxID=3341728 RepID=UPI003A802579
MTHALIALGANYAAEYCQLLSRIKAAVTQIECEDVTVLATSRFYFTPCFPTGSGPDYVNAAVFVSTCLSGQGLLRHLHGIEAAFGRERKARWGARTLDLDLLSHGESVLPDRETYDRWRNLPFEQQRELAPEELILPHPRLHERAFVLIPLADIAPDWMHPVLGHTVTQMLDALPESEKKAVRPAET